jgi:broad specificity phosphatase PhoE
MKYILLIRHLESIKNIQKSFSSLEEQEPLTSTGIRNAKANSDILQESLSLFDNYEIICSNSKRAFDTCSMIFGDRSIAKFSEFNSIIYEEGGKLESEIISNNPEFMSQLNLYRNGLLSSYNINVSKKSENLVEYEKRVFSKFKIILEKSNCELLIFVLHRSPITTILINLARKYLDYPKNFFGFVPVDIGKGSLITLTDERIQMIAINEEIRNIEKLLRTTYIKNSGLSG